MRKIDNFELESLFFDFCEAAEIMTFIDIGSNKPTNGTKFIDCSERIISHKIKKYYAFEANPYCFKYFFERNTDNFIFSNLAISDSGGFLQLQLPIFESDKGKFSSGFLKRVDRKIFKKYHKNLRIYELATNLGASSERHLQSTQKFLVPSVRLDTLFPNIENLTILWIDVEGALKRVLDGCGSILYSNRVVAVFVEFEESVCSEDDLINLESHKKLLDTGFTLRYYSELNNGIYVKNAFHQYLIYKKINLHGQDFSSKRFTKLLRLKSLFYSGDNLMKYWTKR